MSLAKDIKDYRTKYKLSLREFGKLCDMSSQGISNIENNIYIPTEINRERIQNILDNYIPDVKLIKTEKTNDLTGKRFGKLTVIGPSISRGKSSKYMLWVCECQCGNLTKVKTSSLKLGETTSCGCYQREVVGQLGRDRAGIKRNRSYKKHK